MTDRSIAERPDLPDRELIDALESDQFQLVPAKCPCGVMRSVAPAFHRRSTNHDCVHHPRSRCWTCKGADRMVAAVEARLHVEAMYGPFVVTRWERATQR